LANHSLVRLRLIFGLCSGIRGTTARGADDPPPGRRARTPAHTGACARSPAFRPLEVAADLLVAEVDPAPERRVASSVLPGSTAGSPPS